MAISKATWGHVVTCCVFCAISIGIWSCTIEITGVVRVIVVISKCGATICNLALLLAILFVCCVKIFYPIPVICSISTKSVECLQLRHFIKLQKLNLENTWFYIYLKVLTIIKDFYRAYIKFSEDEMRLTSFAWFRRKLFSWQIKAVQCIRAGGWLVYVAKFRGKTSRSTVSISRWIDKIFTRAI